MTEGDIAAGWYPDPTGSSGLRWFDGTGWTEHTTSDPAVPEPVEPADPDATTSRARLGGSAAAAEVGEGALPTAPLEPSVTASAPEGDAAADSSSAMVSSPDDPAGGSSPTSLEESSSPISPQRGAPASWSSSVPPFPVPGMPQPGGGARDEPRAEASPTGLFAVGVGVVAVVWAQMLVLALGANAFEYYGVRPAAYGGLLVAGCGAAALTLWPAGRRRLMMTIPLAALGTSGALLLLPNVVGQTWATVAVVGIGIGVAVGARPFSVALGGGAGALASVAGLHFGFWEWHGIMPFPLSQLDELSWYARPGHQILFLMPGLVAGLAALGVQLTRTNSALPGAFGGAAPDRGSPGGDDGSGTELENPSGSVGSSSSAVMVAEAPDVLAARLAHELVTAGAVVTTHSPSGVTGFVVSKGKPSVLVAVLLWFVCVVPMVIYLVNASKEIQEPFTVTFTHVQGLTRLEAGGVGRGMAAARWALQQAVEGASSST